MTPQKLAENYYRKAKNQKLEIQQLEENLQAKDLNLKNIKKRLEEIERINSIKILRQYVKEHNLIKEVQEEEETLPYKELLFEGYQILIGKNARSNDTLIQKFAKKDDLWLHAKDSSGSHVVVKQKGNQNFPKNVIEKAAELAAYHSKQKNDTFCPVIYTPRKFIRKIKGAAPGAVKVEKEKVIIVKPSL
jgi:predicted ribosome quality control (RQC) complex YloA/Tae2 family protein